MLKELLCERFHLWPCTLLSAIVFSHAYIYLELINVIFITYFGITIADSSVGGG